MYFGQNLYRNKKGTRHGRWVPLRNRQAGKNFPMMTILEWDCPFEEGCRLHEQIDRPEVPFRGPFYADFDAPDPAELQKQLVSRLETIIKRFHLNPDALQLWFSGKKGFHLIIPAQVFGASDWSHERLPQLYRAFAKELGLLDLADPSVYSGGRGRMWRMANHRRSNGLHKIPLTLHQLKTWRFLKILVHARAPRPEITPNQERNPELAACFQEVKQRFFAPPKTKPKKEKAPMGTATGKDLWELLQKLPAPMVDEYDGWLRVGMAIHYETRGSQEGLALWDRWSRQSVRYESGVTEEKWASFTLEVARPFTVASLIDVAGGCKKPGRGV